MPLTNQWMMQIAAHYNGNPNVAGYDLVNEPMNAPSNQAAVDGQNSIFIAVRSQDPAHICIPWQTGYSYNSSIAMAPARSRRNSSGSPDGLFIC